MTDRRVVVLGLLHAGLALARALGRSGVDVSGIVLAGSDFGLRSRYLRRRCRCSSDGEALAALRDVAGGGRIVAFPERDEHVELILRRWKEVRAVAVVPMPDDPEVVRRLRRKDLLPSVATAADVAAPRTVAAESEEAIHAAEMRPPFLVKPAEGQRFALTFGQKVVVAGAV